MWESGANVNDTKCSAFPFWYEEALRAEEGEPEPELQPGLLWCQGQCTFRSMSKFPPTPSEV